MTTAGTIHQKVRAREAAQQLLARLTTGTATVVASHPAAASPMTMVAVEAMLASKQEPVPWQAPRCLPANSQITRSRLGHEPPTGTELGERQQRREGAGRGRRAEHH